MKNDKKWITARTACEYMSLNEIDLKFYRKQPQNKVFFRETKTSKPNHVMYEYQLGSLESFFNKSATIPNRLMRGKGIATNWLHTTTQFLD